MHTASGELRLCVQGHNKNNHSDKKKEKKQRSPSKLLCVISSKLVREFCKREFVYVCDHWPEHAGFKVWYKLYLLVLSLVLNSIQKVRFRSDDSFLFHLFIYF